MLVHIFQIIPVTLLMSNYSNSHLFDLGPTFPEFNFLILASTLAFVSSLKPESRFFRTVFNLSLSALYLLLINKLFWVSSYSSRRVFSISPGVISILTLAFTKSFLFIFFIIKTPNICEEKHPSHKLKIVFLQLCK